jgi:glyoxylate reductase
VSAATGAPTDRAEVLVTQPLPPPNTQPLLDAGLRVEQCDRVLTRAELLDAVAGRTGVLCQLTERVDAEFLEAAGPQLRVVANYAVGFDNIDVAAARQRGVVVTNTPDVLTDATADLAFGLLLAAARHIGEGERLVRAGGWEGWDPRRLLGAPVWGRTIGVLGMGKIGLAVARRARGFAMEVLYTNRSRDEAGEREVDATFVGLDELLARSDFLSVNAPLTPETHHLIDAAALARMKPTAILVNTARGPLVDEIALADALERGAIAGAGLDVFEHEPRVEPRLLALDNVVVLPHVGSATTHARAAMVRLASDNIVAVLRGEPPPTPVDG